MPGKILVIEDNERNRKLLKLLLQSKGYEVVETASGEEALRYLEGSKPDIILLDIQLPNMDGLTLAKNIKSQPDKKDIPIVAVTAYAMKGDREKMLSSGCDAYVSKPIDTRSLPILIENLISRNLNPS